jgi:hypothetical protein
VARSGAVFLFVSVLVFPSFAVAQVQPFEAIVTGIDEDCSGIATPLPPQVRMEWFRRNEEFSYLDPSPSFVVAAADGRNVFGLREREGGGFNVIHHLDLNARTVFYSNGDYVATSLAHAADGRLYVIGHQGADDALLVISAAGVLEATYPFPERSQIAVGVDNCTLYYADTGTIARFNGCTGTSMTPFASTGGTIHDVYPLTNGSVLAAVDDSVILLNAAGAVIRTIPLSNYGFGDPGAGSYSVQIALSTDDVLFVAVGRDCDHALLRIAFNDGTELSRRRFEFLNVVHSLVLGPAATADVPTTSETALLIIALAIAGTGAMVLRLRA